MVVPSRWTFLAVELERATNRLSTNHNAAVQNHPPIQQMCKRGYQLAGMDQAFAALITDLADRMPR